MSASRHILSLSKETPLSTEKADALKRDIAEHFGCDPEDILILPPGFTLTSCALDQPAQSKSAAARKKKEEQTPAAPATTSTKV